MDKYLEHILHAQNVFGAESGMSLMSPVTRAQLPNSSHPPAHLSLFTNFLKWMLLSLQEPHLYFGRIINSNSNSFSRFRVKYSSRESDETSPHAGGQFVYHVQLKEYAAPVSPFSTSLNNLLKFLFTACSLAPGVLTLVSKAHPSTVDVHTHSVA